MRIKGDFFYLARLITTILVILVLGNLTWGLLTNGYADKFHYVINATYGWDYLEQVDDPKWKWIYNLIRAISIGLLLYTIFLLFRLLKSGGTRQTKFSRFSQSVIDSNMKFVGSLTSQDKVMIALLLASQFTLLTYLMFNMPVHYDETLSYRIFSGKGFLVTILYYPFPNNHIFYNIVAGLATKMPVDPYIAIRLPNVLISVASTYYFVRLASHVISVQSSVLASALFAFALPMFVYGVQARGYAFLIFFAVATIYCFIKIAQGENVKKYLLLYTVGNVLGLYTVPTFIYLTVPMSGLLFIFYLQKRRQFLLAEYVAQHLIMGVLTFLCYLPMLLYMGFDAFEKAYKTGVAPIAAEYSVENVITHLKETSDFLTSGYVPASLTVAIILFSVARLLFRKQLANKYVAALILLLVLSPLPLLFVQKSIPFTRTWCYLIIPLALSTGTLAEAIFYATSRLSVNAKALITSSIVAVAIIMLVKRDINIHRSTNKIDYVIRDYISLMEPKLASISKIGRTNDFSWYFSEMVESEMMKRKQKPGVVVLAEKDSVFDGEIIITEKISQLPVDSGYNKISYNNDFFEVYLREDLKLEPRAL